MPRSITIPMDEGFKNGTHRAEIGEGWGRQSACGGEVRSNLGAAGELHGPMKRQRGDLVGLRNWSEREKVLES